MAFRTKEGIVFISSHREVNLLQFGTNPITLRSHFRHADQQTRSTCKKDKASNCNGSKQCIVHDIRLYEKLYKIRNLLYELHVIRKCHYHTSYTETAFQPFCVNFPITDLYFSFSEKQFFQENCTPMEHPVKKIYAKKCHFATAKIKIKNFYLTKMKAEINFPEYGKKCWSNYRFK